MEKDVKEQELKDALNDILDVVTRQDLINMTGLPEKRVDEIFELYMKI